MTISLPALRPRHHSGDLRRGNGEGTPSRPTLAVAVPDPADLAGAASERSASDSHSGTGLLKSPPSGGSGGNRGLGNSAVALIWNFPCGPNAGYCKGPERDISSLTGCCGGEALPQGPDIRPELDTFDL